MSRSGVRGACHRSPGADGTPIDQSEEGGLRFLRVLPLSKGPVSLDEGHGPRRQEQTGRQMGVRIGRVSPNGLG